MTNNERDFTSVSPSAKTLLLMKGYTNIPYARRAAEIMSAPAEYHPDFTGKDFTFCIRVAHFEVRYRSINKLLTDITVHNILELSSGFSFRGLDMTTREHVHYIDTDLTGIIETKTDLIADIEGEAFSGPGKLEVLPLNALDEQEFRSVVSHFAPGAVVIVNEGLLMYLNIEEKKRLCGIIHKILAEHGGYWITTDIYLKNTPAMSQLQLQDDLQRFLDQHHIEENKFESFESAEQFFKDCGLVIDAEAEPDYTQIEAIQYAIKLLPPEILAKGDKAPKIQTTWRLKIA